MSAGSAFGQDYFRQLGTPTETSQVLPYVTEEGNTDLAQPQHILFQPEREDRYNLALGPLRFSASAGMGVMWTDNLALSSSNRQSDFVISPSLNIDAKWRMTEINTLHFSMGLGYSYYLQNSQYDTNGMTLSPNSELAFTMHVGDFAFTFRDQFALLNDPVSLTGLSTNSGSGNFRRFDNEAGVTTNWYVNALLDIGLSYNHFNLWILGGNLAGYDVSDQAIDSVSLSPQFKVGPGITLGLNASASYVRYTGSNTNGQSYMFGPSLSLDLTKNTQIGLDAGYQYFGNAGNSAGWNSANSNSIYARVNVDNRLNDYFSHRLSFSDTTEAGYNSNYYNLYDLEYAANWKATPSLTIDMRLIYQYYATPATFGTDGTAGTPSSSTNRYGTEIGTRYQLTPSVSLGLSYRYFYSAETNPSSNAYQNSVQFNVFYSF